MARLAFACIPPAWSLDDALGQVVVRGVVVRGEQAESGRSACVHLVRAGVAVELDLFGLASGELVKLARGQVLNAAFFVAIALLLDLLPLFDEVGSRLRFVGAIQANVIAARHEVGVWWHHLNALNALKARWLVGLHGSQCALRRADNLGSFSLRRSLRQSAKRVHLYALSGRGRQRASLRSSNRASQWACNRPRGGWVQILGQLGIAGLHALKLNALACNCKLLLGKLLLFLQGSGLGWAKLASHLAQRLTKAASLRG